LYNKQGGGNETPMLPNPAGSELSFFLHWHNE